MNNEVDQQPTSVATEQSGPYKLTPGQKHILTLIRKGAAVDGWAPISKFVAPVFIDGTMPKELCEFERMGEGGRGRLTEQGNNILDAMAWL